MLPSVISVRSFIWYLLLILLYITCNGVYHLLYKDPRLYICNANDRLETYFRFYHLDIVIYPKDSKNILECLGKGMPFYDKKIEVVIGSISPNVKKELERRYVVSQYVSKSELRVMHLIFKYYPSEVQILGLEKNYSIHRQADMNSFRYGYINVVPYFSKAENDKSLHKDTVVVREGEYIYFNR